MRAVLDTNILISGIFWSGSPYKVLEAWINDKFELIVSEETLIEYSRVLKEFEKKGKGSTEVANTWILFIAQNSKLVQVVNKVKICRDPFDDMFLSLAVAGGAKYMKEYMNVEILTATQFLRELN
jgi:uncharacterized protein